MHLLPNFSSQFSGCRQTCETLPGHNNAEYSSTRRPSTRREGKLVRGGPFPSDSYHVQQLRLRHSTINKPGSQTPMDHTVERHLPALCKLPRPASACSVALFSLLAGVREIFGQPSLPGIGTVPLQNSKWRQLSTTSNNHQQQPTATATN